MKKISNKIVYFEVILGGKVKNLQNLDQIVIFPFLAERKKSEGKMKSKF